MIKKLFSSLDEFLLSSLDSGGLTEDLFDTVDKSLGGQSNSSLSDRREFSDVAVWDNLVFTGSQTIVSGDSNFVGLVSEFSEVSGVSFRLGERESGMQVVSDMSKISPCVSCEWSLWVRVISVDDIVPNSVELVGTVVALQKEVISTFVSIRKVFGVSITVMKRLMDVTIVMDEKSQSERSSFIFRFGMGHNGLVSKGIFGTPTTEPGEDLRHNRSDVLFVH